MEPCTLCQGRGHTSHGSVSGGHRRLVTVTCSVCRGTGRIHWRFARWLKERERAGAGRPRGDRVA